MIKTFEDLFRKMEADGKKKRKLQDAYEWLEEAAPGKMRKISRSLNSGNCMMESLLSTSG